MFTLIASNENRNFFMPGEAGKDLEGCGRDLLDLEHNIPN